MMPHIDWVDGIILAILALSIVTGLVRGFVKEAVALCVWILAIWFLAHDLPLVTNWLLNYINDHTTRVVVGILLIIVLTVIAGSIINMVLRLILHNAGLTGTDRLLGMVFGFLRGVFIVSLLILIGNMTAVVPTASYIQQSRLYNQFTPIVNWLSTFTPGFIHQMKAIDEKKSRETS